MRRLVHICDPPPVLGLCSEVVEMPDADLLWQDHLKKKHVRLGHLSQQDLDELKEVQTKVAAFSPQQKGEIKWRVAYQHLHGLTNGHPVPSPC